MADDKPASPSARAAATMDPRQASQPRSVPLNAPLPAAHLPDNGNGQLLEDARPARPGIAPLSLSESVTAKHHHLFDGGMEQPADTTTCTSTAVSSSSLSSSSSRASMSSPYSSCSTTSTSSMCSSRSSSASSIVRAIDFAYCLSSPSLYDDVISPLAAAAVAGARSKSSPSMSSNSRRPSSSGRLLSLARSSSSASSSYAPSSSSSSRRRRSSVYSQSSSASLASQFRDWAITEGPLSSSSSGGGDVEKSATSSAGIENNHKLSLNTHSISSNGGRGSISLLPHPLSLSPASSSEIFSPMMDVPPFPESVFPAGVQEEEHGESALVDDIEGLLCFQPGW